MMEIIFIVLIVFLSASIHEYAHAWSAYRLGDPTPKYMGRLTINPIAHIDIMGSILMPLLTLSTAGMYFGWAKPVPVNTANMSHRYASAIVAFCGPLSNILLAILAATLYNTLIASSFLVLVVKINISLALFNLLPIPPLDGSKIIANFLPYHIGQKIQTIGLSGLVLVIFLLFFISRPLGYAVSFLTTILL